MRSVSERILNKLLYSDDSCWIWRGMLSNGYPRIKINKRRYAVTRIIFELGGTPIQDGHIIRHTCDNPPCVNPDHLLPGTHDDNVKDRVRRKRSAVGVSNGRAKLYNEQVISIYNDTGTNYSELARLYSVDDKVIENIKNRKTWKSVTYNLHNNHSHKLIPRIGGSHPGAKLTRSQADEIRELYNQNGLTQKAISEIYGIHRTTIGDIINNKTYRDTVQVRKVL